MNFPVWDLGFAHGLLIAIVAVTHVYVSHFAVGGGLFLVLTEIRARKTGDTAMLDYLHHHSRFFILLTLVFGAISGVGIWFTIGLINPAGTSALIHAFVWGWAIEWVFFIVEIVAAMIYYYGWNRMRPQTHVAVGWVYFLAAWLSMVIINGILSFQLTPGRWLETHGFWDGFFNPTYFSSLFARSLFAVGLAGLFALLTGCRIPDAGFRSRLLRLGGMWSGIGIVGTVLGTLWWWSAVPEDIRLLTEGNMPIATAALAWTLPLTIALAALVILGPIAMPRLVRMPFALLILLVGLVLMGSGEWLREAVRKPWVIQGYLYSNGIRPVEVDGLRAAGLAANALWVDPASADDSVRHGEALFQASCMNCHARRGYNGLASRVAGWDRDFIVGIVQRAEHLRRPMPPWIGTEEEAGAVADYLLTIAAPLSAPPSTGLEIFEQRCNMCHSVDGFRSLRDLVEGLDADELDEYLTEIESDEMPAFTGSEDQRRALAAWLAEIGAGADVHAALDLAPAASQKGGL